MIPSIVDVIWTVAMTWATNFAFIADFLTAKRCAISNLTTRLGEKYILSNSSFLKTVSPFTHFMVLKRIPKHEFF